MQNLDFTEIVRAVIMLGVLVVVAAIAYFNHSEAAVGALLILIGLGGNFFFHSKVTTVEPDGSSTVITPSLMSYGEKPLTP